MAELTKNDIRDVVIGALEPFAQSVQADFRQVNSRLDSVENRLTHLETQWEVFQKNASELFIKLDEFITLYRKQEMEFSSLAKQIARLEARVEQLESSRG